LPRIRDDAVQFLSRLNVQVIQSPESFPGFVLGDVPVVNAKLSEQRFGIRDRVELDQSDFIGGPLSRHQAVVFSLHPAAHFVLSKPDVIASFNAQTLFAATEVAVCHPDDGAAHPLTTSAGTATATAEPGPQCSDHWSVSPIAATGPSPTAGSSTFAIRRREVLRGYETVRR
jgi:hypothetical protein